MKLIRTLLLSSRTVVSAALMGLFLQDPLILPEINYYDDFDDAGKKHNVVLFDDGPCGLNNTDAFIKKIAGAKPGKCILYTCSSDKDYITSFISPWIGGIISQTANTELLREGIIAVAGGKRFYCGNIEKLFFSDNEIYNSGLLEVLTVREKEVLFLLNEGMTNKEIAGRLSLSIKTIGRHKENIKDKLGLRHTSELYKL